MALSESPTVEELKTLRPESNTQGYRAGFLYCINGRPLRGSAYPPLTVLYRRANAVYVQDGHTQRVEIKGEVRDLQSPLLHDDRKPLAQWLQSQARYMRIEAKKLAADAKQTAAVGDFSADGEGSESGALAH